MVKCITAFLSRLSCYSPNTPNDTTAAAVEEGRRLLSDPAAPKCSDMNSLRSALDD